MTEIKETPTREMLEYISADGKLKEAEKEKELVRGVVLTQLKESDVKYEGISHRQKITHPMNQEAFFQWVKEKFPDKVDSMRVDQIDPVKFERAFVMGEIDYEVIPPECYTEKVVDVITVAKRKG